MISEENATILTEWVDNLKADAAGRDNAIREALKLGATAIELGKLTGLTRARIYQIRDGK